MTDAAAQDGIYCRKLYSKEHANMVGLVGNLSVCLSVCLSQNNQLTLQANLLKIFDIFLDIFYGLLNVAPQWRFAVGIIRMYRLNRVVLNK